MVTREHRLRITAQDTTAGFGLIRSNQRTAARISSALVEISADSLGKLNARTWLCTLSSPAGRTFSASVRRDGRRAGERGPLGRGFPVYRLAPHRICDSIIVAVLLRCEEGNGMNRLAHGSFCAAISSRAGIFARMGRALRIFFPREGRRDVSVMFRGGGQMYEAIRLGAGRGRPARSVGAAADDSVSRSR